MTQQYTPNDFLPTSVKEIKSRGWDQPDIILLSGDAYVDHPSFAAAVIGRLLEAEGYHVAIIPQPNWRDDLRDFKKLGKPRLFFGVTAGNMDSMVNHYTAAKRLRSDDAYTPAGRAGARPDYASVVYCNILKQLYPDTPIVLGGIEASLRRVGHYDYWQDCLKPSILLESKADILAYGMGDKVIIEIAKALHNGFNINLLRKLKQVAFIADKQYVERMDRCTTAFLHPYPRCVRDKNKFAENFRVIETESNKILSRKIVEPYDNGQYVVINEPYPYLTTDELDHTFALPFTRRPHPRYTGKGAIPAYEMIKFSINLHRGCFGGCSFCTISAHQGKHISSRSPQSILAEVDKICNDETFKGYLSDIGGPSANMYGMRGDNLDLCQKCSRPSCIHPTVCKNMNNNHAPLLKIYEQIRKCKGIKKAFIGSGIRYDMIDEKHRQDYLQTVIKHHTSGRLKVAPEHTEERVLTLMREPSFDLFLRLNNDFKQIIHRQGLNYQLIPYFISSHPGCTIGHMQELARKMRGLNFQLEQVQDFTPTPMTLSSVMYYTGTNPYTQEKLFVEQDVERKKKQKNYFFRK